MIYKFTVQDKEHASSSIPCPALYKLPELSSCQDSRRNRRFRSQPAVRDIQDFLPFRNCLL